MVSCAQTGRFPAALLDALGQAIIVTDLQGRITFWNPAAETMYGWSATEAVGQSARDLLVSSQSRRQGQEIMTALMAGESWHGDFDVLRRSGESFPALVTDTPVFDDHGELVAIVGLSTDISERKRAEQAARALSVIVESSGDSILTKALDGTILTWNRGAEELYGYPAGDVIGRHVRLLDAHVGAEDVHAILATVAAGETVRAHETVRRRRDGSTIDVSLTVSPIYGADGAVVSASEIGRDIADRRRLEEELTRLAMHDSLTGLPNRTLLADRLSHALAGSARRGVPVAVLFLDLDRFKSVNDAHGHLAGDQLLVEIAARLSSVIRPADTCARFGGDEFVIICEDTDQADATGTAQRIASVLARPVEIAGHWLEISASIGIAVTPPIDADADTLLRCADTAMYDAKARGRARASVFEPATLPLSR
jgi:diguanylate cyclase (GGDEF)-like protein/PAS domain S-box-containing protein